MRQQLALRDAELAKLRVELTGASTARASAEASRAAAEKLLVDQRAIHEKTLEEAKLAQEKALADLREAFRAMSAEKGVTPGTVELDPRSDETQEAVDRTAPAPHSLKPEAEIITPDVVEPVVVVETEPKPDAPAASAPEKKNDVQE